jgi:carboxymethylenebutenolidase
MPPPAERLGGIACPLLGIYGGEDGRVTGAVPAFADAMSAAGKRFEHHVYPGAPHAFFNDTRPAYRVGAARDAWARTLGFLVAQLG